jgi:hypothetical protein
MEAAGANAGMMGARLIEKFRLLMPRSCERYRMSAFGTSRQLLRRGAMSGVEGEPDSITDGLDQTLLG